MKVWVAFWVNTDPYEGGETFLAVATTAERAKAACDDPEHAQPVPVGVPWVRWDDEWTRGSLEDYSDHYRVYETEVLS